MPFGLVNAPSVFMRVMSDLLDDLPFVIVCLDDILVFSRTPEKHVMHVQLVLERLRKNSFIWSSANVISSSKKSHAWDTLYSKMASSHIQQRSSAFWKEKNRRYCMTCAASSDLQNISDGPSWIMQGLLHHWHDCWRAAFLDARHKSYTAQMPWSKECFVAFEALKEALTKAPTLLVHDFDQPFEIITNASDIALGAILLQGGKPVT